MVFEPYNGCGCISQWHLRANVSHVLFFLPKDYKGIPAKIGKNILVKPLLWPVCNFSFYKKNYNRIKEKMISKGKTFNISNKFFMQITQQNHE